MSRKMNQTASIHLTDVNTDKKANSFSKTIRMLLNYISGMKWFILLAATFSIGGAILNLIGPDKLSEITNIISSGLTTTIDIGAVVEIGSLLIILYLVGYLLNYTQGVIMTTVSQTVTKKMRTDISKKINRLPLRYYDQSSTGDILSRVTNDVDTVGQTLNQSISTLVSSIALLLGSTVMMFMTNWIMALTGILAALIGIVFMAIVIMNSQKYFMQQQEQIGTIDGHIEEIYSGQNIVKVYNGVKKAKVEFHEMNDQLFNSAWKSQFLSGLMMPLMSFIGNFAYVAVCVTGAILAIQGMISFGTIVAFILYIRIFTQPLQNLSQVATNIQSMTAACQRVFEFLEEEEMEFEKENSITTEGIDGKVEFDHVQFAYHSEKPVIHDFSATILPGQKVAIVGPTGAGKTTIVNLLMRFYEVTNGRILIDDIDIQELTRENVHDLFGMVLQDTWIFDGTIRENILYNTEGISEERLDEVCEATGLSDLIRQLPNGYDTILNDSTNLSNGQKQLITIARAMIKDAPLLILDEATSSVDTRTEVKVQESMDLLMEGRTSFVIAHRLSTIKNADVILVIKEGDIIERGTHDVLLEKNGFYADLYKSQFDVEAE